MKPDIFKFLEDVKLSVDAIEHHIRTVDSLAAYTNNLTTVDAVERRLAIIGEAIFKADKFEPDLPITGKAKIIILRHILVHEYDLINDATIWKIVKENLPILKAEVIAIINNKING